jgi:hypothetical protein
MRRRLQEPNVRARRKGNVDLVFKIVYNWFNRNYETAVDQQVTGPELVDP